MTLSSQQEARRLELREELAGHRPEVIGDFDLIRHRREPRGHEGALEEGLEPRATVP